MTAGDYIATCIFVIGGLLSIFTQRYHYIVSSILFALTIIMWTDDFAKKYAIAGKLFLSACMLAYAFVIIWNLYKKILKEKQTIEEFKSVPYFVQSGIIPESLITDKRVLSKLFVDRSVHLTDDKGKTGEYLVSKVLHSFEGDSFKIVHNVYVPKEDGTTSEIDILCITSIGYLIIESKNYSGWIYGSSNKAQWTQTIFGKQSNFYNPIWQNNSHKKTLSLYTGTAQDKITSIIVFSDDCELRSVPENKRDTIIVQLRDLNDLITFLLKNRPIVLQDEQIELLYLSMLDLTKPDNKTILDHIQDSKLAKFFKLK